MKKFLAILMAICMMASMLCVSAFAAESADKLPAPADGTLLRVTANKGDDIVLIGDYTDFEEGWSAAMGLAGDTGDMKKAGYDRVIVKFYSDWKAEYGYFTTDWINDDGFKHDTICIPEDAKVTIDLNGHTINRNRSVVYPNGEVMYIDEDADVIIKNGTITGGWSDNGAGGIHVNGANVTLENVNVEGNTSHNDDGGGIALYDGASLVMNGGSLKDNKLVHYSFTCYGGAIYASESSVTLNNVEIKNNLTLSGNDLGAVIYADESTVLLNECTVDGNGIENEATGSKAARSIIHAIESSITVKKTTFTNNGDLHYEGNQNYGFRNVSSLFYLSESTLVMENGNSISKNKTGHIIQATDSSAFYVSDTTFTDNNSIVLSSSFHKNDSYFNNCTFNNNSSTYISKKYSFASHTFITENTVTFYNCRMGNSTYSNPKLVRVVNENLESPILLTLSALKTDGTTVTLEEYRSFEEGWNTAMSLANDDYWMRIENMYQAIVVDLHADWIATNGRFTQDLFNGAGFSNDTIFIPEFASIILNMNGHTINRGLTEVEADGEVIYIMPSAEVTINNGTITGGYSDNGAGGIHISGDATVTLNNVNVDGNKVKNDDGAGIAVYGGATLIMNGGSISNNVIIRGGIWADVLGGGICVDDSTAILTSVTLKNNLYESEKAEKMFGSAVYCTDSTVTLTNCTIEGNGVTKDDSPYYCAATVYAGDSTLVIENTSFIANGSKNIWQRNEYADDYRASTVVCAEDSDLTLIGGKFTDNNQVFLISLLDSVVNVDGVDFTGNESQALIEYVASSVPSTFANCKFGAGTTFKKYFQCDFEFEDEQSGITFVDCDFGRATFSDKNAVKFVGGTVSNGVGSIFGEGSLTTIFVIIALIDSVVSIYMIVLYKKKNAVPAAANNATEAEDEE